VQKLLLLFLQYKCNINVTYVALLCVCYIVEYIENILYNTDTMLLLIDVLDNLS